MSVLFMLTFLASFPALLAGLIHPKWVLPGVKAPTRKLSSVLYLGTMVSSLFLVGLTLSPGETEPAQTEPAELAAASSSLPPNSEIVSQSEYGDKWAYTIPEGILTCTSGSRANHYITLTYQGKTYAINGTARGSKKYRDLQEIWRNDPRLPGAKVVDSGVVERGLTLCK